MGLFHVLGALSSTPSRPTTAGLVPSGRLAVEKKVDAIMAEARTKIAAKQKEEEVEKLTALASGNSAQVVNPTLAVDPDDDLSVEDMEKAIYAYLAQADFALEAINTNLTVEQLTAAKEAEEKAKAELAAMEAAKAKSEHAVAPSTLVQPSDTPVAPMRATETPAGGVKRSSSNTSAPSLKGMRRTKPAALGTRDG